MGSVLSKWRNPPNGFCTYARTHIHTYTLMYYSSKGFTSVKAPLESILAPEWESWLSSLFSNEIQSLYIALDKVTKCSSKNSFSEWIQKCSNSLKRSCSGQQEVHSEGAAPWLLERRGISILQSGRDRDQLRPLVSVMVNELSADWEVKVGSLHTWSHSALLSA